MEIRGIGTDLFRKDRLKGIADNMNDPFFLRSFTPAERADAMKNCDPVDAFTGLFAGKEAVFKAISDFCGDFCPSEIEILHTSDGSPVAALLGATRDEVLRLIPQFTVMISLSHETECAIAFAVLCEP